MNRPKRRCHKPERAMQFDFSTRFHLSGRIPGLILICLLVAALPWAEAAGDIAIVTASGLNLRKGPQRNAEIVRVLKKGETVRILGQSAGWLKVDHDGLTGFIKHNPKWVKSLTAETAGEAGLRERELIGRAAATVSRKLAARKAQVAEDLQREKDVLDRLNEINRNLNRTTLQVRDLTAALERLNAAIKETRQEIAALTERIKKTEAQASRRLVALYKLSWLGRVQFLASAGSINDFLGRKRALNKIVAHDEKVFRTLLADHEQLSGLMGKLKTRQTEKQRNAEALSAQLTAMEAEKTRRSSLLKRIQSQKSLEMAAIKSLKASAVALDGAIQAFLRQAPPPEAENFEGAYFATFKGLLNMPVEGKIIKFFGPYKNPRFNVMNFRSGIEIQAERGEPIRSVRDGRVLFASWFKGYGNMIIIDHGKNFCTVYAHAEELFKQKGDTVLAQEVIATVGDTGSTPEPGLYFEVRHHGKPMNPIKWIHHRG